MKVITASCFALKPQIRLNFDSIETTFNWTWFIQLITFLEFLKAILKEDKIKIITNEYVIGETRSIIQIIQWGGGRRSGQSTN